MKPTLKEKKRYIVFGTDAGIDKAQAEVENCVVRFIGTLGAAKANAKVLTECWDNGKGMGVIRCSNRYVDKVKASLAFSKLKFRTFLVTGMIKKAKTFIRQYKG